MISNLISTLYLFLISKLISILIYMEIYDINKRIKPCLE